MNCLQVIGPVASIPFPSKEIKKSTSVFFFKALYLALKVAVTWGPQLRSKGELRFNRGQIYCPSNWHICLSWASTLKESKQLIRFRHNSVYMIEPSKCAGAAMISRSFSFSHMLELRVVKGVIISEGLLFTCDYKDFAFRGVKLDVVTMRPLVYIL